MKIIFIVFIALMSIQFTTNLAVADSTCLKKCVGALNAFEFSIKNGKSDISSDWVRGTSGWLLMNAQVSRKAFDEINNHVGSMKDILSCSEVGVLPAGLDLFVLAFHGYLPANPFEELAECFAVLLVAAPEMDKKLGSQRSQSLGVSNRREIWCHVY